MTPIMLVALYACGIFSLILFVAIVDSFTAHSFYNKMKALLLKGKLDSYALDLLIKDTKVRKYYVFAKLRSLYITTIIDGQFDDKASNTVKSLLDNYEIEVELNSLPKIIRNTLKLLRDENNKNSIIQLTNAISVLYLSDKIYKWISLILGLLSLILVLAPMIFN